MPPPKSKDITPFGSIHKDKSSEQIIKRSLTQDFQEFLHRDSVWELEQANLNLNKAKKDSLESLTEE